MSDKTIGPLTTEEIATIRRFSSGLGLCGVTRFLATIDIRDKTIAERDAMIAEHERARAGEMAAFLAQRDEAERLAAKIDVANEQIREVRGIVCAKNEEETATAVRRAFGDLRAAYIKGMDEIGVAAVEQIEGALRDGATGMRDACLILIAAAGQGQPPYIAAAMDALRKAIETLLVP